MTNVNISDLIERYKPGYGYHSGK